MTTTVEQSLYERLGGYDALAGFVDDLIPRMTTDPQIGVYWRSHLHPILAMKTPTSEVVITLSITSRPRWTKHGPL